MFRAQPRRDGRNVPAALSQGGDNHRVSEMCAFSATPFHIASSDVISFLKSASDAPAGVTARELIEEFCGGMAAGETFKAYLPGGASGGILPASMADIPLDFGTLEKYGCFVGSHAVVILSDKDDMKAVALNLMKFFEDESCGQCTPCRSGTQKAALLMQQPVWNKELLDQLSQAMRDASICGLGQAASNPLTSVIKYFPDGFRPRQAAE